MYVIKWHEQALLLKFNLFDIYYEKLSINKLSFSRSCAVWCRAHAQRQSNRSEKPAAKVPAHAFSIRSRNRIVTTRFSVHTLSPCLTFCAVCGIGGLVL